jgi:glycosyltransferase involved in cell wall biosynthesis
LNRSDAALLFDTLRRVLRDCPACHFALIGKHGATVPADLSSHPRFHETGYVSASTLEDYVAGCDALLALLADTTASRARWPSKVNGFLSAGRVPVMTRVGDLAALLEREGAAAIADPRAEDVANCVVRLLEDRDERDRIAHDARRVAETELAWPILTRRLAAFYQSTASAAATPGIS